MQRDDRVETALASLPQGLDGTYHRIVQRNEGQHDEAKHLALTALMWVLYAARPLHVVELEHVLAADRAYDKQEGIRANAIQVILEARCNLFAAENDIVKPLHYSVQDFFTSHQETHPKGYLQRQLAISSTVHASLASACVKYVLLCLPTRPCQFRYDLYRHLQHFTSACYAGHYFDWRAMQSAEYLSGVLRLLDDVLGHDPPVLDAILVLRMANDQFWRDPITPVPPPPGVFRDIDYPISQVPSFMLRGCPTVVRLGTNG